MSAKFKAVILLFGGLLGWRICRKLRRRGAGDNGILAILAEYPRPPHRPYYVN